MKTQSDNSRILKSQYLLEKAEFNEGLMKKAFSRISEMLASIYLGRKFNEDSETYLNSKPELKEFKEWSNKVIVSNNYQLIEY